MQEFERKKINVGIADDSEQLRKTLTNLINAEQDMEVGIKADNGFDLLIKIKLKQPEIILMDIRMPELNGIETTRELLLHFQGIKIIVLTHYAEPENVIAMYKLGINSFLRKDCGIEEILKAIRTINSGGNYMTDDIASIIRDFLNSRDLSPPVGLKDAERNLIKMLMQGHSSKEIGSKIFKSPRTVEDMREKLYIKLNVENKEQLIVLASRWNLESRKIEKT